MNYNRLIKNTFKDESALFIKKRVLFILNSRGALDRKCPIDDEFVIVSGNNIIVITVDNCKVYNMTSGDYVDKFKQTSKDILSVFNNK